MVFKVCEHDINFSVQYCGGFLSKKLENEAIINQKARIGVDQRKFKFNFLAEQPGIYKIVLDNTFSWFTKKFVFFNATVLQSLPKVKYFFYLIDTKRNEFRG